MRDNWYEVVERMYSPQNATRFEKPILELNDKLDMFVKNQRNDLTDIKRELKEISGKAIDQLTPGTIVSGASAIANASIYPSGGTVVFGGAGKRCENCGYYLSFTSPICPSCGKDNS